MAKLAFSKLGLKQNEEIKTIKFNDQEIEIKQYLPVNDKLSLIARVIASTSLNDVNNFQNPIKVEVFGSLEILYSYTNINFTDKQKEDPGKLYDLVDSSGLLNEIVKNIPEDEYNFLIAGIEDTVDSLYKYKASVLGILETINQDYSNMDLNADKIKEKLSDPDDLKVLKETLDKLG